MSDEFEAKAQDILEWLIKEIVPQRIPGRLQILLPNKIAQALRDAQPKYPSDEEIAKASSEEGFGSGELFEAVQHGFQQGVKWALEKMKGT